MWSDIYISIGIFGSATIAAAYLANLYGSLRTDDWRFPLANLIGASMILVSLYTQWNLPAAIIEGFWAVISVYGLSKTWCGVRVKEVLVPELSLKKTALENAIELKNFAIRRGLPVPDATLQKLSEIISNSNDSPSIQQGKESDLDIIIRDLTNITWPTTIRTLEYADGRVHAGFFQLNFRVILFFFLIFSLIMCVGSLTAMNHSSDAQTVEIGKSLFALSLGLLGSTTYIFFSLMNVISEKAVDESDVFSSYARLLLGPAFGWLFYQMVADGALVTSGHNSPIALLAPFAAGFSTRLVLGIINQVIQAIELTLGLGDKRSELKARGARK